MVKEIRYTEIFYSLQGEGRFVGTPSVFFRTFGCNFRCMNFGLPRGTPKERYNKEVKELIDKGIPASVNNFKDLPIIHTGCDTYASIYPEFKHFNKTDAIENIPDLLLESVPNNMWVQPNGQDIHLVMTGGEPLLGWQVLYPDLFMQPKMQPIRNVTFETNATQLLRDPLYNFFDSSKRLFELTMSCSPKLSVSGESWKSAIKPEIVRQYSSLPNTHLYLKFVVADKQDVEEVRQAVSEYKQITNKDFPVYLMPLGGRSEEYDLSINDVADLAMKYGWRFTPRLHIDLYGNKWGT